MNIKFGDIIQLPTRRVRYKEGDILLWKDFYDLIPYSLISSDQVNNFGWSFLGITK